ncbi:hypothetical protein FHY71_00300 [Bacillus tropicus]|uniref:Uncharacterized protein n=1 Tax=Bacillus tropicus TaxID=2026188 RepID=A0A5C5AAV3_9BACI|nr:hypothetical protein FHY71_00300 [Bacillus tropicus]
MKFISAIFKIYRPYLKLYRRFFKYIDCNSNYIGDFFQYIDLPTITDNLSTLLIGRSCSEIHRNSSFFPLQKNRER